MCIYAQSQYTCTHPGPLTLLYPCARSNTSTSSSSSPSHPPSRFDHLHHTPPQRKSAPCPIVDTFYTAIRSLSTPCQSCKTKNLLRSDFSSFRGAWARVLDTSDPVNSALDGTVDTHFQVPVHGGQAARAPPAQTLYAPKCCERGWTDTKNGRGARPGEFMDSNGIEGGYEGRLIEARMKARALEEEFDMAEQRAKTRRARPLMEEGEKGELDDFWETEEQRERREERERERWFR